MPGSQGGDLGTLAGSAMVLKISEPAWAPCEAECIRDTVCDYSGPVRSPFID